MPFQASPMFPGDLYDTTLRVAADAAAVNATLTQAQAQASDQASDSWQQFLELGWQAVLVPEASGGAGSTFADVASIAEAAGRYGLTTPLVARCAVVPAVLSAISGRDDVAQMLGLLAAGEVSIAPVFAHGGSCSLTAMVDAEGVQLQGSLRGIDLSEPASHLLFLARSAAGEALLLLASRDQLGGSLQSWAGHDGRLTADLALKATRLPASAVLQRGRAAVAAAERANTVGALVCCAQIVGAIGAMVEQTIEYLNTRQQFGVQLSTFQALRHRTVEMYVAYESVRGMVRERVVAFDLGDGDAHAVALLKHYLSIAARQVGESAIQLHGGIGMSRELPAARLAMHAIGCSLQWGDRYEQLDSLAAGMAAEIAAEVAAESAPTAARA